MFWSTINSILKLNTLQLSGSAMNATLNYAINEVGLRPFNILV